MKLSALNATFVQASATDSTRVGLSLECPCGCPTRLFVPFKGAPGYPNGWERTGETIETLSLRPSIQRHRPAPGHSSESGCSSAWHGFITNGEAVSCWRR